MIDKEMIEYIANLARLSLTEEEKNRFSKDIDEILEYVKQLDQADTEGIEPTSLMAKKETPLREDVKKESLPLDKALQNGPVVKKNFFAIPKVIS